MGEKATFGKGELKNGMDEGNLTRRGCPPRFAPPVTHRGLVTVRSSLPQVGGDLRAKRRDRTGAGQGGPHRCPGCRSGVRLASF